MSTRTPPRAAQRRKSIGPAWDNAGLGIKIGAVVIVLLLFAAIIVAGGLLTMLIWNVGIAGIGAACGFHVGSISLGVAILFNLFVAWMSRVIHGS